MKKIFTLIAVAAMALSANAQKITFGADDVTSAAGLDGKTFSNGSFSIALVDKASKMAIDANNAYFGTAEDYAKHEYRLKSGAKTQSGEKACQINVTIPADGTLSVYARTGSNSATDRTLVIAQGATTLYNKVVQESDATIVNIEANISDTNPNGETKVYPVISVAVKAGTAEITFPVGSMNFYGFKYVPGTSGVESVKAAKFDANAPVYNLAGQKVGADYKGIVIKNGVKMIQK